MRAAADALLRVAGIAKSFGGVHAVKDFSCEVQRGEIVGLIGPNGSGKSTSFGMISGTYRPDRGSIVFEDAEITGLPTYKVARCGLLRTFQLTRVFGDLSVAENLTVGRCDTGGVTEERVVELLELVDLSEKAVEPAGSLSFGQQRLLELVRGACLSPRLFLLDEPFAGINPTMEQKLVTLIKHLRTEGMSFLIVDHEMRLIMELCDYIYVMDAGANLADGIPSVVRNNPATLEAYFGKGYVAGARSV